MMNRLSLQKKRFATGLVIVVLAGMSLLVPTAKLCAQTQTSDIALVNTGRRIQLDGFLLEWSSKTRSPLGESTQSFFDVVATPDGVAGYCIFSAAQKCGMQEIRLLPDMRALHRVVAIPLVESAIPNTLCATSMNGTDRIVEWLLPWDSIPRKDSLSYRIGMVVMNACTSVVAVKTIIGEFKKPSSPPRIISPMLITQGIVVLLLFVAFFYVKARFVGKRSPRRKKRLQS